MIDQRFNRIHDRTKFEPSSIEVDDWTSTRFYSDASATAADSLDVMVLSAMKRESNPRQMISAGNWEKYVNLTCLPSNEGKKWRKSFRLGILSPKKSTNLYFNGPAA